MDLIVRSPLCFYHAIGAVIDCLLSAFWTVQLSLATFCEIHGPSAILCTSAQAIPCDICLTPSSPSSSSHDPRTLAWHRTDPSDDDTEADLACSPSTTSPLSPPNLRDPSADPFTTSPPHNSASLPRERVKNSHCRTGDAASDTCASCAFEIPKDVASPSGPHSSPLRSGNIKSEAPILRSKAYILVHNEDAFTDEPDLDSTDFVDFAASTSRPLDSPTFSDRPIPSTHHTHALHYITTRSLPTPIADTTLRKSIVRTLSYESLPRDAASGPLLFGDDTAGYTLAFVFRLSDPRARGHRRTYALLALPGRDARRLGTIMGPVNKVFAALAHWMVSMADRTTGQGLRPHQGDVDADAEACAAGLTPVSSFLSVRRLDFDPRAGGRGGAKGLPEIVGRDGFFIELHVQFVKLLAFLFRELAV